MSKKKPPATPAPSPNGHQPDARYPDQDADIRKEIAAVVPDSDWWLAQPNPRLMGKTPNEVIGTNQEDHLRQILGSIKYGLFT